MSVRRLVVPRVMVRLPCPGDVRSLHDAERICFVDPWPGQVFLSELMAPGRYHRLLVDANGRMVAYLFAAWQYLDLHILKIATLPELRRLGLARRLMHLAEEHSVDRGGESVTLEVRESNASALALYRSIGYSLVGRRRAYYRDGEDALVMAKAMEYQGPASATHGQ